MNSPAVTAGLCFLTRREQDFLANLIRLYYNKKVRLTNKILDKLKVRG